MSNQNDCDTQLHRKAQKGHVAGVAGALRQGWDVETRGHKQQTALHDAAQAGHLDVCRYLIQHCGANVHAKDDRHRTPLHRACRTGHLRVIQYLVKDCGANVSEKCKFGWTPLYTAVWMERPNVTLYLLHQDGVHINDTENNGFTPLYYSVYQGSLVFTKLLLEHGASLEVASRPMQWTPLAVATHVGRIEEVLLLLDQGANPNVVDKYGNTLLHLAPSIPMVNLLLIKCHWTLEALLQVNHDGRTPQQAVEWDQQHRPKATYPRQDGLATHLKKLATPITVGNDMVQPVHDLLGQTTIHEVGWVVLGFLTPSDVMKCIPLEKE